MSSSGTQGPNWKEIGYRSRSIFAVVLSLAILIGGGWFVYTKVHDAYMDFRTREDYIGEGEQDIEVVIPSGASVTQIGDILVENDVVRSTRAFRDAAIENGDSESIQAGRYKLKTKLPAETAVSMLLDPENKVELKITVIPGMVAEQQWELMAEETGVEVSVYQEAAKSEDLKLPSFANGYEGFLFPDTYEVAEPVNGVNVLNTQLDQFTKIAGDIELERRAEELGVSPLDVVTIASIIEREAGTAEDRPKVAAVIYNRLEADMPLQMDSTVHFAVGDFTRVTTTSEDRAVDSPYNTYKNKGLPPGPISNPAQAALEAALSPADISSLYFVAVNLDTGETLYADDEEGHAENVEKFQQWCQDNPGKCS